MNRALVTLSLFCMGIVSSVSTQVPLSIKEQASHQYSVLGDGTFSCPTDVFAAFPQSPALIEAFEQVARSRSALLLEKLLAVPHEQRTYHNTVGVYSQLCDSIGMPVRVFVALAETHPSSAVREAAQAAKLRLINYSVDTIDFNRDIYDAIRAYVAHAPTQLSKSERYILDTIHKGFEMSGFGLPAEDFVRVQELNKEIAATGMLFDKNISNDDSFVTATEEELNGVSPDFIAGCQRDEQGRIILPCNYPTQDAVMTYCHDRGVRQRFYTAMSSRAYPANKPLLEKIVRLRHELGKLLGFKSFAHASLSNQMVGSYERAVDFLTSLITHAAPVVTDNFKKRTAVLPESVVLSDDGKVYGCDTAYLNHFYEQKTFALDDRVIAQYFPLDATINGIFSVYEKFMNISLAEEKIPAGVAWDDAVRMLVVKDQESHEVLGYVILDLFPRPNKYSHAGQVSVSKATYRADGSRTQVVALLMCNFSEPLGDKPSLLTHYQAKTFFHEFGHALHSILGRQPLALTAGTSVANDFVELPSQILEEWLYDKDILRLVSSHYSTGAPLPDAMIDGIIKRHAMAMAGSISSHSMLGLIALFLYGPGEQKDVADIWFSTLAKYSQNIVIDRSIHRYVNFSHLYGYGASYYGYMWAQALALDLFCEIKKHGLLDPVIGKKFVSTILAPGGSSDPNELLHSFLGRKPDFGSLVNRLKG